MMPSPSSATGPLRLSDARMQRESRRPDSTRSDRCRSHIDLHLGGCRRRCRFRRK
jgi:hypothetical protein